MTVMKATLQIEGTDRLAYYDSESLLTDDGHSSPALAIEVEDFEEAQAIVKTLRRSRGQKKAEPEKPTPPPRCIAPLCGMEVTAGSAEFCAVHAVVPVDLRER